MELFSTALIFFLSLVHFATTAQISEVGTRLCPMYIDLWVHLGPCFSIGAEYVHKQMEYFIGCDSSIAFDGQELISPSYANKNKRMGQREWFIRARCCANPINANCLGSPFSHL